jgi:hypothetical protein
MPDKTINFAARFEYLSAIEAHWPDVMESLRLRAYPVYEAYWKITDPNTALHALADLWSVAPRRKSARLN